MPSELSNCDNSEMNPLEYLEYKFKYKYKYNWSSCPSQVVSRCDNSEVKAHTNTNTNTNTITNTTGAQVKRWAGVTIVRWSLKVHLTPSSAHLLPSLNPSPYEHSCNPSIEWVIICARVFGGGLVNTQDSATSVTKSWVSNKGSIHPDHHPLHWQTRPVLVQSDPIPALGSCIPTCRWDELVSGTLSFQKRL